MLGSCDIFSLESLYSSYLAYGRPGLIAMHFLGLLSLLSRWVCSFNPAHHPALVKAPRLLGSAPSAPHVIGWTFQCYRCTLSCSCCKPPGIVSLKLRHLSAGLLWLCCSFPLVRQLERASHRGLTRSVCGVCRIDPSWSSPLGARAGCYPMRLI